MTEIKYYTDEKGIRHVLTDPDEAARFIKNDAEWDQEMSEPIKFKEVLKEFWGVLFWHKVRKTLDRL